MIIIPVGVDYAARRYPVVTFTLIGINVLIYLIQLILGMSIGSDVHEWIFTNLWLTPATAHWYNYITTLFVHDGLFHVLGNMIYLFLFGSCVEDLIGRGRFLLFYFLGGLFADFSYIACNPGHFASEIPLGGASGAVSACIGGFLVLLPSRAIDFKYVIWFFFRVFVGNFEVKAWIVITFWFLEDLVSAILEHTSGVAAGVAFAAHLGGTLFGVGLLLAYQKWMRPMVERKAQAREAALNYTEPPTVYLLQGENQIGPYTTQQVKQMLELGAISSESFYWKEGMAEWRSVGEFMDSLPTGV